MERDAYQDAAADEFEEEMWDADLAARMPELEHVDALFLNPFRNTSTFYGVQSRETDARTRTILTELVNEFSGLKLGDPGAPLDREDKLRVERYRSGMASFLRKSDTRLSVQFNLDLERRLIMGQEVLVRAFYVLSRRKSRTLALDDFYDRDGRPVTFRLSSVPGALADTESRLVEVGTLTSGVRGHDVLRADKGDVRAYVSETELEGGLTQFVALVFAADGRQALRWVLVGTRPTPLPGGESPRAAATMMDDDDSGPPPPSDLPPAPPSAASPVGRRIPQVRAENEVQFVAGLIFDSDARVRVLMLNEPCGVRLPGGRVRDGQRPWQAFKYHYRRSVGDFMPPIVPLFDESGVPGFRPYDIWNGRMRVYVGKLRSGDPSTLDADAITKREAVWMPWRGGYGHADTDHMQEYGPEPLPRLTSATDVMLDTLMRDFRIFDPSAQAPVSGLIVNPVAPVHELLPIEDLAQGIRCWNLGRDAEILQTLVKRDVGQLTPQETRETLAQRFASLTYQRLRPRDNNGTLTVEIFNRFGKRIKRVAQGAMITPLTSIEEDMTTDTVARTPSERSAILRDGKDADRDGYRRIGLVDVSGTARNTLPPRLRDWFQRGGKSSSARSRIVRLKLEETREIFGRDRSASAKERTYLDAQVRLSGLTSTVLRQAAVAAKGGSPFLVGTKVTKGCAGKDERMTTAYLILEFGPLPDSTTSDAATAPGEHLTLVRVHLYRMRNAYLA